MTVDLRLTIAQAKALGRRIGWAEATPVEDRTGDDQLIAECGRALLSALFLATVAQRIVDRDAGGEWADASSSDPLGSDQSCTTMLVYASRAE